MRREVREITQQLERLRARIDRMDDRLRAVSQEILVQVAELRAREALLQDHIRSAYEQSQTSLLEVLLSAPTLDAATNQVGYLATLSEQDQVLADEIRAIREQLEVKKETLQQGRKALTEARAVAVEQERILRQRRRQLWRLEHRLRGCGAAAQKRAEQEDRAQRRAGCEGDVAAQVEQNEAAFRQATSLVNPGRRARGAQEARRLAEEDGEARRNSKQLSAAGYRWPEVGARITWEWGPTNFTLEPPYTYQGVYYPHFHGGIDMTAGRRADPGGQGRRGGGVRPAPGRTTRATAW